MKVKTIKELYDTTRFDQDFDMYIDACLDGEYVRYDDYKELLLEIKAWREEARANQAVIDLQIEESGEKFTALLDILDMARENYSPYLEIATRKTND